VETGGGKDDWVGDGDVWSLRRRRRFGKGF